VDERDLAALRVDEVTGLEDWISGLALELRGLAALRIQEFRGDGVFVAVPVDGRDGDGTLCVGIDVAAGNRARRMLFSTFTASR
jgi:hypothetical protein